MNQKKARFNIVDIIVLLLLIAGAVFVGTRILGGQAPAPAAAAPAAGNTYRVSFYAECVPEAVASSLAEGSRAENTSRNMDLGTLVEFTTAPSVVYYFDNSGICVQSEKPGYVSVTLVCELTGSQQPTGLQVGQYMLNIGHSMGVCCGNTEIATIVQSIAPVSAG